MEQFTNLQSFLLEYHPVFALTNNLLRVIISVYITIGAFMNRKELLKQREIAKWEREKAKPKKQGYLAWLIFVVCLIYMTDEIASQIGTLMKTEIANDLLASFGQSSVGALDIITMVVVPFQLLGLVYKPLADKWGRKTFLVINTFGMSFAMLLIFLSNNLVLYCLGSCLVQFFIPHDMHVVYIMETAPAKHRARIYSSIKFVANMGVMLVPILRRMLMEEASQWRNVYVIPAVIGLVCSFVALVSARETDAFIDARLRYLKMTDEEKAIAKTEKKTETAEGGLGHALKFAFSHKQTKWLYITSAFVNIGFLLILEYQVIMTYGYAEHFIREGLFTSIEDAVNYAGVGVVTSALFLFTVGSAVAQVIMGFVCDWKGRKIAAITMASICTLSFLGFFIGANLGWSAFIVGFLCGACIGSFYATNDILIMMIGESSPTNLRSSTISAQYVVTAAGVVLSYGVGLPLLTILGNSFAGIIVLCMAVPGFILALLSLCAKTHDTTGIDMDTVTGCEWD